MFDIEFHRLLQSHTGLLFEFGEHLCVLSKSLKDLNGHFLFNFGVSVDFIILKPVSKLHSIKLNLRHFEKSEIKLLVNQHLH